MVIFSNWIQSKSTRLPRLSENSFGMIPFRPQSILLTLLFVYQCSIFSDKDVLKKDTSVHLILNSTGYATEFCLYRMEKTNEICQPKTLYSYPKCVEYFPENSNAADFSSKETLDQIYKGLAELEISLPMLKSKIDNVGFLVSGSFSSAKESKSVIQDVEKYFKSEGIKVNSKIITGEEETKLILAALTLEEEKRTTNKESAILQIETDTVDIAFSGSGKNTKPISSKIGINLFLEEISQIKPGINACRQPISSFFKSEASSFEGCKKFLLENLNKSKRLLPFAKIKLDDTYEVYSVGSSWNYFYPNKENISIEELNKTGNEFCSLTIDEILKKGIKKKNAYNLCYALSYKAVLAESLGLKNFRILKKDIYLKNFSASPSFFPGICK